MSCQLVLFFARIQKRPVSWKENVMHTRSIGFTSVFLASLLSLFLGATSSQATTYTWTPTAAGTYNWNNAASQNNWGTGAGGTFPVLAEDVADQSLNILSNQVIDLNQAIVLGILEIGDTTGSSTFTINNNGSFTFNNGAGLAELRKVGSGGTNTINAPITVQGNMQMYVVAGALNLDGTLIGSSTAVIDTTAAPVGTAQSLRIRGDISGFQGTFRHFQNAAGTTDGIRLTGTTAASQDGSNMTFELNGTGITYTQNASANTNIGADGAVFKMGRLFGSGGVLDADAGASGSMTLEVGHLGGAPATWNGVLARTSDGATVNFTKVGSGILTLGGNNLYNGITTIKDTGALIVNGTHSSGAGYTVEVDAMLGGLGTIGSTVSLFGTISPGDSVGTTAETLTIGGLTLQSGASAFFELDAADPNSANNDLIAILGALTGTGGTFDIDVEAFGGGLLSGENTWTLASYSSLAGTLPAFTVTGVDPGYNYAVALTNLSGGAGEVQLTLTVVPEPGAMFLAAMGIAGIGLIVRRKRK